MTAINFDTLAYSKDLDASERDKLATKGDFTDVRLEIEKLRLEVEKLRDEINSACSTLLHWQIGIGAAIVALMGAGFAAMGYILAKGPGWPGF